MRTTSPVRVFLLAATVFAVGCTSTREAAAPATARDSLLAAVIARGKSLELPTEYVPPPGDALEHNTSGFAKILCTAVFITGLDPADAAENVGYFTSPYAERHFVTDTVVDRDRQEVRLTLPSGVVLAAKRYKSQGCVTRVIGEDSVHFTPEWVKPDLPDAATTPWPMGDVLPDEAPLPELDMAKVAAAVDTAFGPPEAMTEAFVVTYEGRIIGERYGEGIGIHTPLESWSMGKSITGTMMGVLIQQGAYELWQPAPIPEWYEKQDDPRQKIRIGDIMRMSSGIRIRAPQDPDYDPSIGYPDHLYLYTGRVNSFHYAATRPQEWPPNTVGRYRNTDPVLTNYLIRLAVEKRGEDYHAFPQRDLFDKIGIRDAVIETDPYGDFLCQGYDFMSGRDWARLGNLWLQDGVWNGERLLPEGYAEYARTLAPAWVADGRPTYGGAFQWVNGMGSFPVPAGATYFAGAGGQNTIMIPSHHLVVVRLGKYKGARAGGRALRRGLEMLMETVPPT
ncbi:MAG: beta-lactamase family protein [Gemmatimonadetes bacterium]|nr:beta-lactamase family protein [Gemmatimonadota bacterium]